MAELPSFLRAMFEGASLDDVPSTLVAVAPSGIILWVNAAWTAYAQANGGDEVIRKFGPGTSYFDGMTEPLRGFYKSALVNALLTGEPFEQEYECSSPEQSRTMRLRILPFGSDGALLDHGVVVEHACPTSVAAPIEAQYRNANGIIVQCSNCRRVRHADGGSWDWVREWVRAPAPRTSHGICKTCIVYYWGSQLGSR